jgi:hypothetical protein
MAQGVEKNDELTEALKATKNVANNTSWFRGTPHYWAEASLPLAYAIACVEVLYRSSEKAAAIYDQIVEAWGKPAIKAVSEEVFSIIPDSGKEEIKNALLYPESELSPDPNKPFRQLEEMFSGLEVNEDLFKGDGMEGAALEEREHAEQLANLTWLIMEFIRVGFNRESDIEEGRYRVEVNEKAPWLLWAVAIRTLFDSYKIMFERVRDFYKVRKYKGKIIDFHKVLSEQPMSRLHREIVASAKAANLRLKNDKTIMEAAWRWYQCRVVYRSINEFCDAKSSEGIILDPKNVDKQIRPWDDALGYIRRLPGKRSK